MSYAQHSYVAYDTYLTTYIDISQILWFMLLVLCGQFVKLMWLCQWLAYKDATDFRYACMYVCMLNKNTCGAKKGEANQKQQLSDYIAATKSFDIS